MKRFLLFATLCATIIFSNCKKDPDPTPQELLIGKWKVTTFLFHGINVVKETATAKVEFELEFKTSGEVVFKSINTDLTKTPPKVLTNIVNNMYAWKGDTEMTITGANGVETLSVTGPVSVTATNFTFTATSGNTFEFLEALVAEKI